MYYLTLRSLLFLTQLFSPYLVAELPTISELEALGLPFWERKSMKPEMWLSFLKKSQP